MKGNLHKYPGRKWLKHEALWSEEELRSLLPETELFSPDSFLDMIERHAVLFLKPDLGMRGQGIVKVSREEDSACIIQTATKTYRHRDSNLASKRLKQLIGNKRYIVQQGIDLIRIKGKPVDFRVLLHIRPNKKWRFFGIMGKVAAKNRFVTNHSRGGKAIRLHQALSCTFGIPKEDSSKWDGRIKTLSGKIAKAMKIHYPNITELGLDIAIDTEEKIWLIEANTKPQYQLFRHHADPKLYDKIAYSVRVLRASALTARTTR
ncbi:YheC/YheD family protein [Paenibacillus sp. UNC451MF]|uniref:YheC/YheD family protein n=1 Tax=Paenibacillus sp. UNC451MF TaxID=1449063 RepID=UPI00048C3955|nr:YheC/YheD family protein [Paenibacillus sp. UNC451MF]